MAAHTRFVPAFLIGLVVSFAEAQETPWHIVLSGEDTLYNCTLLEVNDSLLVISRTSIDSVVIDSVAFLFRTIESSFWTAAGYGTLVGAAAGALILATNHNESSFLGPQVAAAAGGLVGAVGGFAVGGLIGATSGGTEVYDLLKQPHHVKIMILRQLLDE